MYRLFFAIELPNTIRDAIADLQQPMPSARWLDADQLHLTLRFIGNVDGGQFREMKDQLQELRHKPFELRLSGTGFFGKKGKPHTLWVGVEECLPLQRLKQAIDRQLQQIEFPLESRKFHPHVSIARLNRGIDPEPVARFLESSYGFAQPAFEASCFYLFSSKTYSSGAVYTKEEAYPLALTERERLQWFSKND